MRRSIIILLLLCGCSRAAVVIPDNASELRVALCPAPLSEQTDPTEFVQELRADPWRLFADQGLEEPLGGLNEETAFGRKISDDVWGVLAVDFENTVCEVYAGAENATPL